MGAFEKVWNDVNGWGRNPGVDEKAKADVAKMVADREAEKKKNAAPPPPPTAMDSVLRDRVRAGALKLTAQQGLRSTFLTGQSATGSHYNAGTYKVKP